MAIKHKKEFAAVAEACFIGDPKLGLSDFSETIQAEMKRQRDYRWHSQMPFPPVGIEFLQAPFDVQNHAILWFRTLTSPTPFEIELIVHRKCLLGLPLKELDCLHPDQAFEGLG